LFSKDFKNKDSVQELLIALALVSSMILLSVVMSLIMTGCTTLKHEPKCSCMCTNTSSYFECGGDVKHVVKDFQ